MNRYKVKEVIKLLEEDGWILMTTKGDHRQFKHPTKKGKVTVRGKSSETLDQFLLNSIWNRLAGDKQYPDLINQLNKKKMANHKLSVDVSWTGKNFCCAWSDDEVGTVVATAKNLAKLKEDFAESLKWHIEGCVADGDTVPEYLVAGDYDLDFNLDTAALLRDAETYTTMAAISRASGINQKQLSHYANGIKQPRPMQRARIIAGLHLIGTQIMSLC